MKIKLEIEQRRGANSHSQQYFESKMAASIFLHGDVIQDGDKKWSKKNRVTS